VTIDDTVHARLDDLFAKIDAKDTERFLEFLTDGASFRFGSAPPVRGQEAIHAAVDGFFASIAGSKHKLTRIIDDAGILVCEGEVTYTRHDATEVTLPFASFLELEGDLISNYKIYADAGPLYAP